MSSGNGSSIESEKYQVIRELGRGGMGVVYLAEDRQLRRQVALKVLYDYLNRDRAFVERFQEEACSVSTLHHPNIVCVHGLERAGDTVAIDMELVEGVSLDQLAPVTPHLAAGIARDVLGGLAACHQIGVVHRDIKPSNILLNQVGQAKITDFGLATAYANHMETTLPKGGSSGFYMGTPRYMPIQAWEGGNPEPFWDLYSFGVVLHELISGRPAFKGDNPIAVMRRQLVETLPPLHNKSGPISLEFSKMVEALLNSCKEGAGLNCAEAQELLRNTPEFKALQECDAAPTLPALPRFRRKPRRARGTWRSALPVAAVSALVLIAAGALYSAMRPVARGGAPSVPPEPSTPASSSLLPTPGPSGTAFYDAEAFDAPDEEMAVWMVEFNENGKPSRITGTSKRSLWSMEVEDAGQGLKMRVKGNWGSRLSESAAASEYGSLDGTLLWNPTIDQPVLSLTRIRGNDRERNSMTIACQRKPENFGKVDFLRSIESNGVVMSLLYRDLLPRRLPWVATFEAGLPALEGARAIVPPIIDPIVIDGRLDEPTWINGVYDATVGLVGELTSQGGELRHRMLVRWNSEAVIVALDAPGVTVDGFEIGIAPMTEVEPLNTGRYFVTLNAAGALTGTYSVGGTRQAWICDWKARFLNEGGAARAEIEIPISSLKPGAAPTEGRRWRLNTKFTMSAASEGGESLPHWGDSELKALEHGVLLVFKAPKK